MLSERELLERPGCWAGYRFFRHVAFLVGLFIDLASPEQHAAASLELHGESQCRLFASFLFDLLKALRESRVALKDGICVSGLHFPALSFNMKSLEEKQPRQPNSLKRERIS